MPVGQVGIMRIPCRRNVLDRDGMLVVHPQGERRRPTGDVLRSTILGGSHAADEVLVRSDVKHGPVAEDEPEFEEPLRGRAVVIVAFTRAVNDACRAVADAAESRALERHLVREPPLGGRPEREGRTRNAEDLRRNVVVRPVEAPDSAIRVAHCIGGSDQEAPGNDVLEGVGGGGSELENEAPRSKLRGASLILNVRRFHRM